MTDQARSGRRRELLGSLLAITFLLATIPNTIEAFTDIEGEWWTVLRAVLSVGATIVLALYLRERYALWRARRRVGQPG